jgi:hypothetical protein
MIAVIAMAVIILGGTVVALTAGASTASAAVTGLQVVSAVTEGGPASPKSVTATCPAGKRVVGTGVYIDGVDGRVMLDDLIPTSTTVRVTGYEDQAGTSASWWIRAFAVCSDPLRGLEIVSATKVAGPNGATANASCSAGKRSLGAGASITGGLGQVVLDAMRPTDAGASATAFEDADGAPRTWRLTSYAICAVAPAGLERVIHTAPADSQDKVGSPTCSAGKHPLGIGWNVGAGGAGRVGVDIAWPQAGAATIAARENGPNVAVSWSLVSHLVCAPD